MKKKNSKVGFKTEIMKEGKIATFRRPSGNKRQKEIEGTSITHPKEQVNALSLIPSVFSHPILLKNFLI